MLALLAGTIVSGAVAAGPPEPASRPSPAAETAPATEPAPDPEPPAAVGDGDGDGESTPVRLAIAGDTGTAGAGERATADRMARNGQADPYDALVLLGDLVYDSGEAALVGKTVLSPFAEVIAGGAELVPVLGNHDYRSGEQDEILKALGREEPWYVARIGKLRIVVLDSNRVGEKAQTAWLRATLAEPVAEGTWTIAAMHHPAFSAGHHGSDAAVREAWAPLFAEFGVGLVLAGHDHDYQRSLTQDGVTYVVSGAGATLRPTGREEFTAVSSSTLHYLELVVTDDRIEGEAIGATGAVIDAFTIRRP